MIHSDLVLLEVLPAAPQNGDRPRFHDSSIIRRGAGYAGLDTLDVDTRLRYLVDDGYAVERKAGNRRLFARTVKGNETIEKAQAKGILG